MFSKYYHFSFSIPLTSSFETTKLSIFWNFWHFWHILDNINFLMFLKIPTKLATLTIEAARTWSEFKAHYQYSVAHSSVEIRFWLDDVQVQIHAFVLFFYIKRSADCILFQKFVEDECRCRCADVAEREECDKIPGKVWDTELCRCLCPPSTFAICKEDEVYDFRKECRYL